MNAAAQLLAASGISLDDAVAINGAACKEDLRLFTHDCWHVIENEPLQWDWYLDAICDHLTLCYLGDIQNLIIAIPPRFLKSTLVSVIWPSWCWANDPSLKFLTGSYEIGLATRDALRMRDLVQSDWYRARYGIHTTLKEDQNVKNLYLNESKGMRMAVSVAGKLTGYGGNIHIIDDPHNLQDIHSDTIRNKGIRWYTGPLRSRFDNYSKARRVIVAQRSHAADLIGHLRQQSHNSYVYLCLQNEFVPTKRCITRNPKTDKVIFYDPRTEAGELLCPQRLDKASTATLKIDMTAADYSAQFQQDPTTDGGLILKREYWRPWVNPPWRPDAGKQRALPECFEIIQIYDTAFEEDEEADYTARVTLGIFQHTDETLQKVRRPDGTYVTTPVRKQPRNCAILLGAWRERLGFPELRMEAKRSYDKVKPDWVLVEKKATGSPLIKELRRAGVPVKAIKIDGAGDKVARAHTASLPMEKGCLYYLPDYPVSKAVIDECADFPNGEFDDWVDCLTMGLMWLRRSDGVAFQEEADEVKLFRPRQLRGIGTS
jgi:predicted phage terminase large subunit-like protein